MVSEKPLSPDDPLAQFAENLRQLRRDADEISYRRLAERANVSPSALSQATSGRKLPTWNMTRAFVKGCDGDEESWYEQWSQVRRELNARQNSTTNGQFPASTPSGKAPEDSPHDTSGIRQSSALILPVSERRSPHLVTPRAAMLVAAMAIVLLIIGAIVINWVDGQEEADPKPSPPVIPTYINSEYQGVPGLHETPNPSLEAIVNPPYTVGSGELQIVCQVSDGLVVGADFLNAAGASRDEENDVWYRVLPSNYYVPAVYTTNPFGVEGDPVPDQPFEITIPECTDVPN